MVPLSPREKLSLDGDLVRGDWHGRQVPAGTSRDAHDRTERGERDHVGTGAGRRRIVRARAQDPFISLESPAELNQLRAHSFDAPRRQLADFWRAENRRGARLRTPMPQLDALHMSHLTYVQISDPAMPGEPELINTSVGTSTYSNCGNESCMINEELDQRGLVDEARRRLEVWLKYQGTEPLIGRFSDKEGVLHGAGASPSWPRTTRITAGSSGGWPSITSTPGTVPGSTTSARRSSPRATGYSAAQHTMRNSPSREAGNTASCRPGHSRTSPSTATG